MLSVGGVECTTACVLCQRTGAGNAAGAVVLRGVLHGSRCVQGVWGVESCLVTGAKCCSRQAQCGSHAVCLCDSLLGAVLVTGLCGGDLSRTSNMSLDLTTVHIGLELGTMAAGITACASPGLGLPRDRRVLSRLSLAIQVVARACALGCEGLGTGRKCSWVAVSTAAGQGLLCHIGTLELCLKLSGSR
jgi:hypothetical protein